MNALSHFTLTGLLLLAAFFKHTADELDSLGPGQPGDGCVCVQLHGTR